MKYRIKFSKYSSMVFIGHLDMMRYFQKAIRRAGLPIAYSTGFSPHQILSFAAPLGVGLFSNGEYADLEFTSEIKTAECKKRLQEVMVEGVDILSVKVLPKDAGNAMASVSAASYTVSFVPGREPVCDIEAKLPAFLAKESIMIIKEGKKGPREVNIRPGIYECTYEENTFHFLVDASSAGNIKPIQIIEALLAECGEKLQENALRITREETYTNIGTEEERKLVPLGEIIA